MGAFILFPVLIFSVFITSILGFTDWIHVDTLVHAAAQAAVTAAAENAIAPGTSGIYNSPALSVQLGPNSTWGTWSFGGGSIVIGSANGDFTVGNGTLTYVGTGATSPNGGFYSRTVTVVPGTTYTVSGQIDATNVSAASPYGPPELGVYNASNFGIPYAWPVATFGQAGLVSQTFTIPTGVTQIVVVQYLKGAIVTAGQPLTWSNIQLTPQTASHLNPNSAPLDTASVNATVGQMLNGKPYITSYSCTVNEALATCKVHFNVSMPIVGTVHATTTVSATNTLP